MILVKFFNNEQYAKDFLNEGKFRFTHSREFRKYEDGKFRGDEMDSLHKEIFQIPYENLHKSLTISSSLKSFKIDNLYSALVDTISENEKVNREDITFVPPKNDEKMTLSFSYFSFEYIFCLTIFDRIDNNNFDVISNMKNFGNYAVVILDPYQFINKVVSTALPKSSHIKYGHVNYTSSDNIYDCFQKSTEYKLQSEYRIRIVPTLIEDNISYIHFNIKSMKSFAILTTPDLLKHSINRLINISRSKISIHNLL